MKELKSKQLKDVIIIVKYSSTEHAITLSYDNVRKARKKCLNLFKA